MLLCDFKLLNLSVPPTKICNWLFISQNNFPVWKIKSEKCTVCKTLFQTILSFQTLPTFNKQKLFLGNQISVTVWQNIVFFLEGGWILSQKLKKKNSLTLNPRRDFVCLFDKWTVKCVTYIAQFSTSLEKDIHFAWTNHLLHLHAELLSIAIAALKHKKHA